MELSFLEKLQPGLCFMGMDEIPSGPEEGNQFNAKFLMCLTLGESRGFTRYTRLSEH